MIIIGPSNPGTRLIFTISFTVPAAYTTDMGDALVTDNLPNGLSLYNENDTENSVTIDGTIVSEGVSFAKNEGIGATCRIPESSLNAQSQVVVTFDTVISSSALPKNTPIENKSSLTFINSSKFVSTGGSVIFEVTGTDDISYLSPEHAPFDTNSDIEIKLDFTASLLTDVFNYHVGSDFGSNLSFDKESSDAVSASYKDGETDIPISGITITDPDIPGSNRYVFNIPHTPELISKVVTVAIKAKTNYPETAPESILYKYDLAIGGAIGEERQQSIPVSIEVPLVKTVRGI